MQHARDLSDHDPRKGLRQALKAIMLVGIGSMVVGAGVATLRDTPSEVVPHAISGLMLSCLFAICLLPWFLARQTQFAAHVRALLLLAGCVAFGAAVWYLPWHVPSWRSLPQYMSSALTVPVIVLSCIGTVAMYYESKSRLFKHRRIAEQAERASIEAQLRALQAQVEPGFLFGTLASIDALILDAPEKARALLTQLNRYLRTSLSQARGKAASVQDEFALLCAYINITSTRLDGQLQATLACEPACTHLSFPPMLLQPLVELAIPAGELPAPDADRIGIDITAQCRDGRLEILLSDSNGQMVAAYRHQHSSVEDVLGRLFMLFGDEAGLRLVSPPATDTPDTTQAHPTQLIMSIPIERTGAKHLDS